MNTVSLRVKLALAVVILAALAGEYGHLRGIPLSWLRVSPGLVLAALLVCLLPTHKLPGNRVRSHRLRLRMHLHPGRGQATLFAIWFTWSRYASFRESGRARPGLTCWQRVALPSQHSVYLGRAQYGITLRIPVQEHVAIFGPPREGKSGWLARATMYYRGSVVSTSSKPDMFTLTSGVRARSGPVHVFNPQGIGGVPSTIQWSPIAGCINESTAMRMADAFANAVDTDGTDDGTFWSMTAAGYLRAMFHAAALAGGDLRYVTGWIMSPASSEQAEIILRTAGKTQWADQLAGYRGPAEKTNATVKMVMAGAVEFMNDPALGIAALPGDSDSFDIERFLLGGGTLYMIAKGNGGQCALAPLFAALASEIQYQATVIGSRMGGRLDPPLGMFLDEITQIVPVPLPQWMADSGGQGVQLFPVFHGRAQMVGRWGEDGAQTIMDTSSSIVMLPGAHDPATLQALSDLAGKILFRVPGMEPRQEHDILTPAMIRQLPPHRGLVIRRAYAPVIVKMPLAWKSRKYKAICKLNGTGAAAIRPAMLSALPDINLPAPATKQARRQPAPPAAVPALVPDIEPAAGAVPAPDDDPWS
jgi:type IV secretion system protein VirD4